MQKLLTSLLGIFLLASVAGCTTQQTQNEQDVQVVKIGVILPLSGPASNYGKDGLNVYKYVVDQFNASQSGLQIELVAEDGKCEGKSSTSAAQKLIDIDNVQAIVGGFCSAETVAGGKIAQQAGVVMLSPVSDATEISHIGEYVFRFYTNADATKTLANHIHMQTPEKLIIVAENSDTSIGFANDLAQLFPAEQVDLTTYQSSEKDTIVLAKQIKDKISSKDFLVIPFASDVTSENVIKALSKEGVLELLGSNIASNESLTSISAYKNLGALLNGIKTVALKSLNNFSTSGKELAKIFQDQGVVTENITRGVLSAEAMSLMIESIAKVGNNADAIKNYFNSFNPNHLKSGYFGDYYFNDERTAEGLGFLVYEIQNGELIAVE